MDGQKREPANSLSEAIADVTARLKARAAVARTIEEDPVPVDPIDCEALYDLIQAAQSLYRDECPGV